ncbi:CCA tRNA nucleotidyltransferase [Tateyamaria pelophila]|uniref:CCA tRNA nucleotidyltransferase n=1 Tax=Tateyamaria pelophila TaxID=328415 RepID=UPI001CBBF21D|nr:CCA tRNA nucleotidyltransferase [Tateyamaria pelophila]
MDRTDTFKLSAETAFLADPAGQDLCAVLERAGHQAFFVGGCVRNAVMGLAASDIDVSTSATPQTVMEVAKSAGLRVVPTGIDHGTVTVVVRGSSFEVTTFRRDVATDGRRAVVAFSNDIAEDAVRRDFTMNALYADRHGVVHDPLGGLPDALGRRVRFIQDPEQRIREDYLRILRFFRFSAFYADLTQGWAPDALAAITSNLDGLETLSAERIGAEMLKLLSAPDPAPALAVMERIGVLQRVLPGATTTVFGPIVHLEASIGAAPDPIVRLAALGGQDAAERLRLSRQQQKTLKAIQENSTSVMGPKALGYMSGIAAALGAMSLRAAMAAQPLPEDTLGLIAEGSRAVCPVSARDFPDLKGPELGQRLKALKASWLASELTKSKEDLLGA